MEERFSKGAFLRMEYQKIDESIQKIAENELGETKEKRKESLMELRKLIESDPNCASLESDDFLLQFLRARQFDASLAFDLLKKYRDHRRDYPELHQKLPFEKNQKILEENFMNFLPLRTSKGRAIWAVRIGVWNPSECSMEDVTSYAFMCQEAALKNPVTQICGVESLIDVKGMSWNHLRHISTKFIKGFLTATQYSFPMRQKAIHIINHPRIFDLLYALIKPLINSKMKKRIHFHDNETSLHEHLPAEILPTIFGGSNGEFENHQYMRSLLDS